MRYSLECKASCYVGYSGRGEQWDCTEEDKTGQVQSTSQMDVSPCVIFGTFSLYCLTLKCLISSSGKPLQPDVQVHVHSGCKNFTNF